MIAGLQALAALAEAGRPAAEILSRFSPLPQLLRNVKIEATAPLLDSKIVQDAIVNARGLLGREGRLLVRPSGTEPLIRIMAEGHDPLALEAATAVVSDALRQTSAHSASPALWREEVIANSLPPLSETATLPARQSRVAGLHNVAR